MSHPENEPLTASQLDALVERAHAEIARLCTPGERWRMTVPVNEDRDSDIILSRALDALAARGATNRDEAASDD